MKLLNTTPLRKPSSPSPQAKLRSCPAVLEGMARVRESMLAKARKYAGARPHLLRLAVNEAESLAWQTRYPHLVFPTLAAEKLEALARWSRHQESVHQNSETIRLAA